MTKKEAYKVKPPTNEKENIISSLIEEYDIENTQDILEPLKYLQGGTIWSLMEEWKNRSLSEVYTIVFIDTVNVSFRENNMIKNHKAYAVLGINENGMKEAISLELGGNESCNFWLSVLDSLKNRGVTDILIICANKLVGMKEAIDIAFPDTEYQRCIVHQVRNTLRYVSRKDKKEFGADLKAIYDAPNEEIGHNRLEAVAEKWKEKYHNIMKSWYDNWALLCPIFKFSAKVRKMIYATKAIKSLNSYI